jgi:ferritin-like metal-binding protein YciE
MDEKVKDMLMIHAGEHYEHASYMGISEAAKRLGENEIATIADQIAEEEKATAKWAEEQIPGLINRALATA